MGEDKWAKDRDYGGWRMDALESRASERASVRELEEGKSNGRIVRVRAADDFVSDLRLLVHTVCSN